MLWHASVLYSFLLRNNILLYGNIILIIHSSIDEHLDCSFFWLIWVMVLWTFVSDFCVDVFHFSWTLIKEVELLDHVITLKQFGELLNFSKVASPFYTLVSNERRFLFLLILTNTCYCLSYYFHPSECEVIYQCGLIYISPVTNNVAHHFMCLFSHLYIFFGEMSVHILCPFLNWVIYFFIKELLVFFILDTSSLSHILFANIFSCSVDCLSLPYGIICSTTFFNFDIYQFLCLLSVLLASNLSTLPNPRSYFFFPRSWVI